MLPYATRSDNPSANDPAPVVIAGDLTGMAMVALGAPVRPPILFLHGMFGGAWQFAAWQRHFAERGYPSTAIDLRGHHDSRPVTDVGRVSMRDYARDALDAATALGRPIVVGHSMGGLLAQQLAAADAVAAAVLLSAAPPRGITPLSAPLLARTVRYLPAVMLSRPVAPSRRGAAAIILNRVPPSARLALLDRMVPESGRAARELLFGAVAVDAARVRCPVLSVAASDDRFVVPRVGRALARKYGGTLRELPGHAHYVLGEPGWETVASVIAEWLAEHVRA